MANKKSTARRKTPAKSQPVVQPMLDMDQAVSVLSQTKHWSIKTVNLGGKRRAHECTIWHKGKRLTSQARTPLAAITVAWKKLAEKTVPKPHPIDYREQILDVLGQFGIVG